MKLREHPLMSHRGIPNWPPSCTQGSGSEADALLRSESGILQHIMTHDRLPHRFYLLVKHDNNRYVATLLFDDPTFCRQVADLLEFYIGCSIREIGDLDMSYTL